MINCFLLNEKAINHAWVTLYVQIGLSQVTSFENLLPKSFHLTTVVGWGGKESFHTLVIFFFPLKFSIMNEIQKKCSFMILGVLMNSIFVLHLGIKRFIVCLHLNTVRSCMLKIDPACRVARPSKIVNRLSSEGSGVFPIASMGAQPVKRTDGYSPGFGGQCSRIFHWAPKDAQFWPATRRQELSSPVITVCVSKSRSPCLTLAVFFPLDSNMVLWS